MKKSQGKAATIPPAKVKDMTSLGPMPEMKWLPVSELNIESRYQRSVEGKRSQEVISSIAQNFNWGDYVTITVCKRDGKYNVIDGQHRYLGAKKRGIPELPCYIIQAESVRDEARHFTALNQNRVRMHTVDMYHARLAAGDRLAENVDKVCRLAGIKICKAPFNTSDMPPGQTMAIGVLERATDKYPNEAIVRALKALHAGNQKTPGQFRARMVDALIRLYADNFKAGRDIDDKRLVKVLTDDENEAQSLEFGARMQPEIYNRDVSKGIMDSLAEAYNFELPEEEKILGQVAKDEDAGEDE